MVKKTLAVESVFNSLKNKALFNKAQNLLFLLQDYFN